MALAWLSRQTRAAIAIFLLGVSGAVTADVVPDRVEIIQTGDRLLVDVHYERGIGGTRLKLTDSAWPEIVLVRLHGFPELESFVAMSKTVTLECVLARTQGQRPVQTCRMGEARVELLRREPDYFEVHLPRGALPADDDEAIDIRWVDQWR